jgi:hypothetical protein
MIFDSCKQFSILGAAITQPTLRFLTLGLELNEDEAACLQTVHQTLDRLTQRRKDRLSISGELESVLREVILYRIVATAGGTIVNWNTGNVLCSFLTARALFETFAFLWDYPWLEVKCHRCGTKASIALGAIRRPRDTPIWKFEASLKCRSCKKGRYAPRSHMIRLTETREITPYVWVHSGGDR